MESRHENDNGRDESRNPKPPRNLLQDLRERMRLKAAGYLATGECSASAKLLLEVLDRRQRKEVAR